MSKTVDFSLVEAHAQALGAPAAEVDGRTLTPMLAERATSPEILARKGWVYELKLDGVRILADARGGAVRLLYRKSRDTTASYPEIAAAVAAWNAPRLLLDGEIVTFDDHGRPSFERLGQRIPFHREADVKAAMRRCPVVYVVFDLLAIGARDLRGLPLSSRRELLREVIPDDAKDKVRIANQLEGDGRPLFEFCKREKLEGVMAKKQDGPYRAGVRGPEWQKIKCETDDEFVVVGWTRGKDGGLGALDLASYEGETLVVRGEAGSGIDRRTAAMLLERFAGLVASGPTATGEYERDPGRTHVRPEVVVSVRYLSWSESGRLRFPTFRGVRDEVEPKECRAAPVASIPLAQSPVGRAPSLKKTSPLAAYYASVAPWLFPYLDGRPIALDDPRPKRGAKRPFAPFPASVRTIDAFEKRAAVALDARALGVLAELGSPLRVFPARSEDLEAADWVTFVTEAKDTALALRDLLTEVGLVPVVKTWGDSALHVMANVGAAPWDSLFAFARLIAAMVAAHGPVDVSPNARGTPLPAPLAVSAAGLVSRPLRWEELTTAPAWTMETAAARLREEGDALKALLDGKGDFQGAVKRVGTLARRK